MPTYLIDTNVLLRSVDSASAEHFSAFSTITLLLEKGEELFLAPQVLAEFWAVATRPVDANGFGWSIERVRSEIDKLLNQFAILHENPAVFDEWLGLVSEQKVISKKVYDARLAALLNIHRIANLLTFNVNDFKNFGIRAVAPDELLS